ncbi:MAG: hypothetical protein JNN07_19365 [Verrucomicrobiales bacterium]|nr:hypothetical protein [Verrucomicrobiales bacterium]
MQKPFLLSNSVQQAEDILNRCVAEYEAASDADSREFYALKVQISIFYYDVILGMLSVGRNKSKGFAQAVALKSLVHNLYEYDQQMSRTLIPRIRAYAIKRKHPFVTSAIRAEKAKWKEQFDTIRGWKSVRDTATGHYGQDIDRQIQLLNTLVQEEVLSVASAFGNYSVFIFQLLPHKKRSALSKGKPN